MCASPADAVARSDPPAVRRAAFPEKQRGYQLRNGARAARHKLAKEKRMNTAATRFSKVPELTVIFWIIKIAATTLGETGGDAVTMSMHLGYLLGTAIFATLFGIAVSAQIAAKHFHPFLYWAVIIATTTVGTTLADYADRSLGIGYAGGASILFMLLMASLAVWYRSCGSVSVDAIASPKVEMFYWVTIMFSQTLGTALGDWVADKAGLGYEGGALVFAAGLAVVMAAYFYSSVSRTLLFWAAFILTRPLGATVGDLLDKPHTNGGLAFGRFAISAGLTIFIIGCIWLLPQKAGRPPVRGETAA
jgi:uncharacterized membrane-anchored protein